MKSLRVFIVDGQPLFRRGLASVVSTTPGLVWAGEAADAAQALAMAPPARPDVLLLDLAGAGAGVGAGAGADALAPVPRLRLPLPTLCIVGLGNAADALEARRAVQVGAVAIMARTALVTEVICTLRRAPSLDRLACPLAPCAEDGPLPADLTPREHGLLTLMARGLDNQAISRRLNISVPTVKFHVTNILSKFGAANRTGAVLKALRHGIVTLEQA